MEDIAGAESIDDLHREARLMPKGVFLKPEEAFLANGHAHMARRELRSLGEGPRHAVITGELEQGGCGKDCKAGQRNESLHDVIRCEICIQHRWNAEPSGMLQGRFTGLRPPHISEDRIAVDNSSIGSHDGSVSRRGSV